MTELINNTHLPSAIRLDLFCGVSINVTPVTQTTLIGINNKAEDLFPFDDSPFRKPLPGSAVEGQTYLDEDDPGYKRALGEVALKRDMWSKLTLYNLSVEPASGDRDAIISRFKKQIEKLEAVMDFDGLTKWEIVLRHILFAYRDDQLDIDRILLRRAPLTFDEVADGLRIFRLKVQKQNGAAMDQVGTSEPSGEQDNE